MFVFVFAKKLTRISLSIVLVPGQSGNTKLGYSSDMTASSLSVFLPSAPRARSQFRSILTTLYTLTFYFNLAPRHQLVSLTCSTRHSSGLLRKRELHHGKRVEVCSIFLLSRGQCHLLGLWTSVKFQTSIFLSVSNSVSILAE